MNVYRGSNRRQVGAGLFSTISPGARPIIMSLLAKLKPHLLNITKSIGKRAAKAAVNVGSDMAKNLVTGRLNKRKAQDILENEIENIKSDAAIGIDEYKQKLAQLGSGKRRKLNKSNMPRKRKSINKRTGRKGKKGCITKKTCQYKRKKGGPKRKTKKVKRRTKRVSKKDIFTK